MSKAELIKALRDATGASFGVCKEAADKFPEDLEKAKEYVIALLREATGGRGEKEMHNGIIEVYTHMPTKSVGCMVEILCETDFVARGEILNKFAHEIALQVVAMSPLYVDETQIPEEEKAKLRAEWEADPSMAGKPANIIETILKGKMAKYLAEVSLMDQVSFKDENIKIKDMFKEVSSKLGENIKISKFVKWQI